MEEGRYRRSGVGSCLFWFTLNFLKPNEIAFRASRFTAVRYVPGQGQESRRGSRREDPRLVLDDGGEHDAVIVSEFPNDEASAKFMLSTGVAGNVTTQTLKAFTEAEYRKIVASL